MLKTTFNCRISYEFGIYSGISSFAAEMQPENTTTMENCGAYLYEWRPIDCGNGELFCNSCRWKYTN